MNLEAILDLLKAFHKDFDSLSSTEKDHDKRCGFILATSHPEAIIQIISDMVSR